MHCLLGLVIIPPLIYFLLRKNEDSPVLESFKRHTQIQEGDLKELLVILQVLYNNFPIYREYINSIREVINTGIYREYEVRFLIYYFSRIGLNYVTDEIREKCSSLTDYKELTEYKLEKSKLEKSKLEKSKLEGGKVEEGLVCLEISYREKTNGR